MTRRPHVAETRLDTTHIHIARFADRRDFPEVVGAAADRGLCRDTLEAKSQPVKVFPHIGILDAGDIDITDAGESEGATSKARMSSFNREATP
jgi:hypothetical protein